MKTKTLRSIGFITCGAIVILQVSALGIKPDYDDIIYRPSSKVKCSDILNTQDQVDISFVDVNLAAPYAFNDLVELQSFHGLFPIRSLSNLITPTTENLDPSRRSFIDVAISGTECSGIVSTRLYKTTQAMGYNIWEVNTFTQAGGYIHDVKIIANSVLSTAGKRLVWTKVYSGPALDALGTLSGEAVVQPTVRSKAVIQYPLLDSMYLHDDTWLTAPVYDDGDFNTGNEGSGSGGVVIDPEPYDSLEFTR